MERDTATANTHSIKGHCLLPVYACPPVRLGSMAIAGRAPVLLHMVLSPGGTQATIYNHSSANRGQQDLADSYCKPVASL